MSGSLGRAELKLFTEQQHSPMCFPGHGRDTGPGLCRSQPAFRRGQTLLPALAPRPPRSGTLSLLGLSMLIPSPWSLLLSCLWLGP